MRVENECRRKFPHVLCKTEKNYPRPWFPFSGALDGSNGKLKVAPMAPRLAGTTKYTKGIAGQRPLSVLARRDNESAFLDEETKSFLPEKGVHQRFSPPSRLSYYAGVERGIGIQGTMRN